MGLDYVWFPESTKKRKKKLLKENIFSYLVLL